MRRKVSHMLLCAVIAFLSGWAGHWLGSRKRSIVHVPETVVRHDTIRSAIPEPEVIVREVPTEVDTAAILADYFSEKHYLDTIIERPYLKVELTDVISRNSLLDRTVVVDYRQPVVCNNALALLLFIRRTVVKLRLPMIRQRTQNKLPKKKKKGIKRMFKKNMC